MKLLLSIFLFFINSISLQTNKDNPEFTQFLKRFELKKYPLSISKPFEGTEISHFDLKQFLNIELDTMALVKEHYSYRYKVGHQDFYTLIVSHLVSPGKFGINNEFIEVITISKQGVIIDFKDIGCFCSDINIGTNDYYSSSVNIDMDSTHIIVKTEYEHATLIEEQSDSVFKEDSIEFSQYNIEKGFIKRKVD